MGRDDGKILKRFANIDIDGVAKKKRPKKRDPGAAAAAAAAPKRTRRSLDALPDRSVPTYAPEPQRPLPPPPVRRDGPPPGWVGAPSGRPMPDPMGPNPMRFEIPPGAMPGVITVEMDLRSPGRAPLPPVNNQLVPPALADQPPIFTREPADALRAERPWPGPRRAYNRPPPPRDTPDPQIEVTEMAAREIRMMAYRHGVTGAALRVLTSGTGGPANCDFAFEQEPEPGDVVLVSRGIRLLIDERSLASLRGTRITYQDLTGAEGFVIG